MACFSAVEVANMFQNVTVDEIINKFDENFLDDIASKIGNNNITTDIVAETVLVSEDVNVVDFVRNAVGPENIVYATDIEIEGECIEKPGDCSFRRK